MSNYRTRIAPVADEIKRLHDEKDEAQRQEHLAKNEAALLRRALAEAEQIIDAYAMYDRGGERTTWVRLHRRRHSAALAPKERP